MKTKLQLTFIILISTFFISKAQTIGAGVYQCLAVCADSTAWAWGGNGDGNVLGDGSNTLSFVPVPVSSLTGIVAIDGGDPYSLALKSDGTVWSWGWNMYGNLGGGIPGDTAYTPIPVNLPPGITAIAAGGFHGLAIGSDSTVWSWGYNVNGELGNGFTGTDTSNVPMQVGGLTGIKAIGAGGHHSFAIKSDSTLWAWGWNLHGQLGIGTNIDSPYPVQVPGLTGVIAVVGNGETNSMALKSDGTVWAWGWNIFGQLGDGTHLESWVPVQVTGLTGITAIGGSIYHSLALKNDSTVWAWGLNTDGQLGTGTSFTDTALAVKVINLTGVIDIASGSAFSLAQKSDGTNWAWGTNGVGQLGNGNALVYSSNVPLRVRALCCVPVTTSQSPAVCNGDSVMVGTSTYTTSGTYTDTLTSFISGCDSIVVTNLTVHTLPTVFATANSSTLCSGDSTWMFAIGGTSFVWMPGGQTSYAINVGPTSTTTYTVTGTDGNGCSGSTTNTITVNPLPTVTLDFASVGILYFCTNFDPWAILDGGSPMGGIYTGLGASNDTIYLWGMPSGYQNFTYTYTDGNSCTATSNTDSIYFDICFGITEQSTDDDILIYPNPSSGIIQLSTIHYPLSTIKITNLLGETVYQSAITTSQSEISVDISGEESGVYFIQINNTINKKFVKQ